MGKNNPFDDMLTKKEFVKSELPQKQNPLTKLENLKPKEVKYKSVRVHPEDFKFFKKYAQKHDISIVSAISLGRDLLEAHDNSLGNSEE